MICSGIHNPPLSLTSIAFLGVDVYECMLQLEEPDRMLQSKSDRKVADIAAKKTHFLLASFPLMLFRCVHLVSSCLPSHPFLSCLLWACFLATFVILGSNSGESAAKIRNLKL
jgi:hypothetical protein